MNSNPSATAGRGHSVTGSVISKDGAAIGYRRLGRGPGLVVLHGAMESAQSHIQLAEALSDSFTVFLPDRRGRGLSGPYSEDYSIKKDVEDLDAILTKTEARHVFGISSGSIVCLEAALTLPAIRKAAVFEPPLFLNRSEPAAILKRYDKELADGKLNAALVTGMKGAQMGPPIFNVIPRRLLEGLTNLAMASEDKKAKDGDVTMRMLAPTLHYDFRLVADSSGDLDKFSAITAEIMLLGGGKSPAYLKAALNALQKILPQAKRVEFPGLGHGASGNKDRGGRPERVAQELKGFFLS
jgi:pimeloyl-ACP methyl ester carboxylesterase